MYCRDIFDGKWCKVSLSTKHFFGASQHNGVGGTQFRDSSVEAQRCVLILKRPYLLCYLSQIKLKTLAYTDSEDFSLKKDVRQSTLLFYGLKVLNLSLLIRLCILIMFQSS